MIGAGRTSTTIDFSHTGGFDTNSNLGLSELTVANGYESCIGVTSGELSLNQVTVRGCYSTVNGGGVDMLGGTGFFTGVTFESCYAQAEGAAIHVNSADGQLLLNAVDVTDCVGQSAVAFSTNFDILSGAGSISGNTGGYGLSVVDTVGTQSLTMNAPIFHNSEGAYFEVDDTFDTSGLNSPVYGNTNNAVTCGQSGTFCSADITACDGFVDLINYSCECHVAGADADCICPEGHGNVDGVCAACPAGTYAKASECVSCGSVAGGALSLSECTVIQAFDADFSTELSTVDGEADTAVTTMIGVTSDVDTLDSQLSVLSRDINDLIALIPTDVADGKILNGRLFCAEGFSPLGESCVPNDNLQSPSGNLAASVSISVVFGAAVAAGAWFLFVYRPVHMANAAKKASAGKK